MASTRYTWQDVLLAPEDGNRYEAIGGELYVTPAPSLRHQRTSLRLSVALYRIVEEPVHGVVLAAPTGVEFPHTEEGAQPDLLVVSRARFGVLRRGWIRGAPDLVVEILSPTTAPRDRGPKLDLYRRQGVAEYWIVDPEARSVEVWRLGTDAAEGEVRTDRVPVRLGGEELGVIELDEVFPLEA
jgi:Uma2 family endonuclease